MEMYDRFMCYCQTGKGELTESIATAKAKIEALTASSKADLESKTMTDAALKEHTASRDDAKKAMAEATAIREKEAAVYAKFKSDHDTNLKALKEATLAIEKGVSGSFLQTGAANVLRNYVMVQATMSDAARQDVLAFLSGSDAQGYVPQSGEIIGILKQMYDEMDGDLKEATDAENGAIQSYEALMAAKTKEVNTLQAQIEEEMMRSGELGVSLASVENDIEDTKIALEEDTKFLAALNKDCSTKTAEWEVIQKTRAEELVALAETIKVLNDDDALEMFKKTLPSASASFVQITRTAASMKARAMALLKAARAHGDGARVGLISLALRGGSKDFSKVVKMIDEMVAILKDEQLDDDHKKEYCTKML